LVRQALVAAELALATMLSIGAGMLLRSLMRLEQVRLGFQPERLLTFQLSLPPARYPPGPKTTAFYRDLVASLNTLPGVHWGDPCYRPRLPCPSIGEW
jgi:putative ABC transport system permease protein